VCLIGLAGDSGDDSDIDDMQNIGIRQDQRPVHARQRPSGIFDYKK